MGIEIVIVAALAGVAVVGAMELWSWWRLSRIASRVIEDALHPEKQKPSARLEPECRFIVRMSEEEVVCERPDGKVERVTWSELQKIEIVTTSEGPMVPDVFWLLHGTDRGCAIPQGATGEKELLERLQKLPGFDNGAVIDAMCCSLDKRFVCWVKPA